ncbi:MAG: SpoIIIAH-like family protein [Syntrophomonadaceae bacterium]|nr:SpoIIIAH-like family protein [Syntrophomonadaceae bacterium]
MIIDRSGIKKVVIYAVLILSLALGSYSFFKVGQQPDESLINKPETAAKSAVKPNSTDNNYCARYRLEREKVRSREISILNGVAKEESSESQASSKAKQRLVQISSDIEKELKAENLVRCHGAQDCIAMVQADHTTLIIASSPMQEEQVADMTAELSKLMECEEEQITLIFRRD